MRTEVIQKALRYLHASEKSSTTPNGLSRDAAYLDACKQCDLTLDERDVLARVTHTSDETRLLAHRNRSYGL